MLFNIVEKKWDEELLKLFDIPISMMPKVKSCDAYYGTIKKNDKKIPINGVIGDQQSALVGQGCFQKGDIKSTYGTGCFLIVNTGDEVINVKEGLLTTIGYELNNEVCYALEGSIYSCGTLVKWLRDKMKLIRSANETEKIVKSLKTNSNVYLVPAFVGLGAPYWDSNARGVLSGLTRDTGPKEIIRAIIESTAYQSNDLFNAMKKDGLKPKIIKIDGGMVKNNWLSQFLSDILNVKVYRSIEEDTTALGAAYMAGLKIGIYKSLNDISKHWKFNKKFTPKINAKLRKELINGWLKTVNKTINQIR